MSGDPNHSLSGDETVRRVKGMKKKSILFLIRGGICLSFSALFFYAAALANGGLKERTPAAIEAYDVRGLDVSMAQAEPFGEGESFAAAGVGELAQAEPFGEGGAFAAAGAGELAQAADEAEDRSVLAYCQVTTPNYGARANLRFREGEYFSADASAGLEAVMPESLAKELFPEGGEGGRLKINGREYTVRGVYEDGGVLTQLGSGKIPVIYCSGPADPKAPAEHLLIGAEAGKTAQQQKQETAVALRTPLEGETHDLESLRKLGESLLLLGFFSAGLWFVLRLCVFSHRKLIFAYECKEPGARRGFDAFWGLGAFLAAVIVFLALLQLVRLPAVYLPENNIFDFSYYGREILSGIQRMNADGRIRDFSRICAVYLCAETGVLNSGGSVVLGGVPEVAGWGGFVEIFTGHSRFGTP